ncbi:HAD-IA family hydrolase [Bosea sp. F3-2]|uniref:HAD family hydrolase n=1 Tax=Bosea sp. F3-2 TaxID=2599640 RepID=UPI0011F0127A|nr:HAD-IA family hydrolase [Bosea sp. F3-2]QEL22925.1 HAD-IA family hydrolase [Bosea sp. F3-2]
MIEERSLEERSRVSAPGIRTFLNIARRWDLSEREQSQLLGCTVAQLQKWGRVAREQKPLALETDTLMRLSAVLGVFADLRRFLFALKGSREERRWLMRARQFYPFNGRAPLAVLSGSFEDQMAVRRHLAVVADGASERAQLELSDTAEPGDEMAWGVFSGSIKAVCFDAFGTVVEIADKRRPYQTLLRHEPSETLGTMAMTRPMGLRELAKLMARPASEKLLARLEADVAAECASTRLRKGMDLLWADLRRAGFKIAICSNLAQPYENALLEKLPGPPDVLVLSFRSGLMKPQQQIYRFVCRELGLQPSEVLFVGDDLEADVLGPSTIDAIAMPIDEFQRSHAGHVSFFAPSEVTELFERIATVRRSEPAGRS